MNILAVIGSPRRGNSYKAVQVMESSLLAMSKDIHFEYLFLSDLELEDCTGCQLCITEGEDKCPLADDRSYIEKMLHKADGVIFVTPVYSFQVTALMKKFLDRFAFVIHRPRFFKPASVVVIRGNLFKEVPKYLTEVADKWGFNVVSKVGILELKSLNEKKKREAINKLEEAAYTLYKSIKNEENKPVPSIKQLIWFKVWVNIITNNKTVMSRDYEYWQEKGWLESDYYYGSRINIFKKLIVYTAEKTINYFMAKSFKNQ